MQCRYIIIDIIIFRIENFDKIKYLQQYIILKIYDKNPFCPFYL